MPSVVIGEQHSFGDKEEEINGHDRSFYGCLGLYFLDFGLLVSKIAKYKWNLAYIFLHLLTTPVLRHVICKYI